MWEEKLLEKLVENAEASHRWKTLCVLFCQRLFSLAETHSQDVAENGTFDAPRVVPDAADDANDDVLANRSRSRGSDIPAS